MNELKVIESELVPVYESRRKELIVNARELHQFLNVGKDFSNWIKDRIEKYSFIKGIDFSPVLAKTSKKGGRPKIEYYLKLDTAKEMAMVENNEQGKKVRRYFIEIEKKARQMYSTPKTYIEALESALKLAKQIEEQQPKVLFAETCLKSGDSILVRGLAKIACTEGIEIGEKRLYKKLREWGLLMSDNEPYQRYIGSGYFEVIERPYNAYDGVHLSKTTKILPKGQAYIINRLKKEAAR